ncbi:MAG: ABC transporter permease [Oscillospiraceae bacterium]|nr:ABC transporter permease [Oscillospiraceae bacterium]
MLLSLVSGVLLGSAAGFYGRTADNVLMRLNDILSAIPAILLGVMIAAALGGSTGNLILATGLSGIPQFVRITRAAVLSARQEDYVDALIASGMSGKRIVFLHILPNCLSPIIVQATLRIASAIIAISSLSFLGLGIPLPAPEWGNMLNQGRQFVRTASYITIFPGLAILLVVLAFNLLGDGLRDAMDPKLRRR